VALQTRRTFPVARRLYFNSHYSMLRPSPFGKQNDGRGSCKVLLKIKV